MPFAPSGCKTSVNTVGVVVNVAVAVLVGVDVAVLVGVGVFVGVLVGGTGVLAAVNGGGLVGVVVGV